MSLLQGGGMICLDKSGQPVPTAQGEKQKPKHKAARSPPSLDFVYRGQPLCGKMCSRQPPWAALRRLFPPLLNLAWKKHRAVRNGWHPQNVLCVSTVYSSINRPHVLVSEESGTTLLGEDKGHSQGNWETDQVHTLCRSASSPTSYVPGLTFRCMASGTLEYGVWPFAPGCGAQYLFLGFQKQIGKSEGGISYSELLNSECKGYLNSTEIWTLEPDGLISTLTPSLYLSGKVL